MELKTNWITASGILLSLTMLTGCVGAQPTLEQQQQAMQMRSQMLSNFMGGQINQNMQQASSDEKIELEKISEQELQTKLQLLGKATSPIIFQRTRSGFSVNTKPYSDYEGSIKEANWDFSTGFATYLIEVSQDAYLIKIMQAASNKEAVTIGKAIFDDGIWNVTTATGKKLSGNTLLMGSKGFTLTRLDGSGFTYNAFNGIKSINVPQEYQVAKFQNGDIQGTNIILLEIPEMREEERGTISGLWSKTKSLGSSLGINKKQDYAFMNIDTQEITKINIPNDGKSKHECLVYGKQINKYVRECKRYSDPVETLYTKEGNKNIGHYYWRVQWYNTANGIISITLEDSLSKIYATNLQTKKKVLIAEKIGGFNGFEVSISANGNLNVTTDKGLFGSDLIEDIASKIASLPAVVD